LITASATLPAVTRGAATITSAMGIASHHARGRHTESFAPLRIRFTRFTIAESLRAIALTPASKRSFSDHDATSDRHLASASGDCVCLTAH
jgi:hypothetical protein